MFIKIINNLLCTLLVFMGMTSYAAQVIQSKNGKVMIDLQGEDAAVNQNILLVNAQNKKVAIAKINQVKNGKAIATIVKGQSQGNEKVTFAGKPQAAKQSENITQSNGNAVYKTSAKKMSVVLSLMSNSMTTKQTDTVNTQDVAMKGSTFGVTGVVDWPVMPALTLRGTVGYEPFKAAGDSSFLACDNLTSVNCSAEITYLSAAAYARYDITQSRTQFWVAGGGAFKFPLAKTTTALKQDDIKATLTYGVALGLDFFISSKAFIPFSVEQQFFLKSDTVSASIFMLRAGYGQTF